MQTSSAAIQFRIVSAQRTMMHGTVALARIRRTAYRLPLGRLAPGHYTLTITIGRGHRAQVALRRTVTIR